MPDIADEAQYNTELQIDCGIRAARAALNAQISLHICECCGSEIPPRRRELVPGVKTCIDCQERKEFEQRVGVVSINTLRE